MRNLVAKIPLISSFGKGWRALSDKIGGATGGQNAIGTKAAFGVLALAMGLIFNEGFGAYVEQSRAMAEAGTAEALADAPSIVPLAGKGIGVFMTLVAFFLSLWIRPGHRGNLVVLSLWIAAVGCFVAWVPTDVVSTQSALAGKALAGEEPSIPAYLGKILLIGFLIFSPPIAAQLYFRLGILDQYVVKSFLSPFVFCIAAFTSIWLIFDFTDNGPAFSGLPPSWLIRFYVVQFPYVILFVLPIVILLSLLFALSRMSKSNELISMIGAGRSVLRILAPLLFIGAYSSLIGLALKYEWAPRSVGLKDAILNRALTEQHAMKTGSPRPERGLWAKNNWMHVNEFASRSWYVGLVPWDLSQPMANVVIWRKDRDGQPEMMWQAKSAKWNGDSDPPGWTLLDGRIYRFEEDRIPRITPFETLTLEGWNETPWKVLSSSQNPEFLGMPGLAMYLRANREMPSKDLAAFRTNLWNIFAEPVTCLAMVLVAAPLGIVYSRKGVLGGVTAAIVIFAVMYVLRGTTMALGQGNHIPPFFAAWASNLLVGGIGIVLLWFRSQNRELPKLKELPGLILSARKA